MDISYILDDLNPIQREAVTEELPYSLVLAGAGSGKTKVITHKVAWLCKVKEINPLSLMTVTFTNKAAKEMRGRIESILGEQLNQMWCGTFHGLFHRMLKMHWQEAGLAKSFSILDGDDQNRVIKRVIKRMNLDEATWQPRQTQWFINKQKDEGRRIAKLPNKATYVEEKMADIYLEYQKTCEEENVVDFAEILLRCYEMLAKNPELLNHYQKRFQHILVDEFQDTNEIQYLLLKQLVGKEGEMTVVGDDDQSIYSWRGAKSSNINRFIKDFKGVKTLKLEQNYRSTTNILSAANAVIRNNPERLGKELWTEKEEGELVKIYRAFNERDEAKFIVDIIKSWVDEGRNLSECAIIYRSNAQSRILEDSILRADLPYRIYGGVRFYERLEIKNALAYAKLAIDQKNDAAFERIINIPTRGVGAKTMDQIREIAREENSSLWIAAKTFADSAGPKIANSLKTFFKLIENFSESAAKKEIEEFFENLIESSNLKNFHGKEPGEKGRSRVENLEELVSAAAGYFSIGEDADDERSQLELFLDQASLDAGENQAEENEDAIQMMTLHSSKGLEYALVFIAGCEEGLFPHKRSTEDPRQLAEERRLCYVGMTRAMERLYLTYAEVRNVYGVDGFSPASRFLKEIPEEFKYEIRMASENINKSKSFSPKIVGGTDHKVGGFALGDRVGHPSFGEGVILNYEGDGSNARVQVNFDQEGTKWLVLSFAKLNKI
ncbi:MAG: DNA helicase II [Flavobacteriaceae bacterium]|jgi:DNA helicase-2/ATP-dependent DNA helicase PcrA|nr:DNA helicase II [Flavobacteriaceae bacterium]|tara:strand:- start:18930 stop:21098 length:2169 start_codon:yes stop_codon:yes gene_type:complete